MLDLLMLGLMLAEEPQGSIQATSPKQPCYEEKVRASGVAKVYYINDGDTVTVKTLDGTELQVRLIAMDTPETKLNGKNQGPWAFRAAARLKQLLPKNQTVQLELDTMVCDTYNRILAYVYADGININQRMVEEGWAVNFCVAPNLAQCEEMQALVEKNIEEKRGFLSDKSVKLPYVFRADEYQSGFKYFVGDIQTKEVIPSDRMEEIPISRRVFFYSRRHILPPYQLAE